MGAIELLDDIILDLEGKLNLGEYRVVFCVLTSLNDVFLSDAVRFNTSTG